MPSRDLKGRTGPSSIGDLTEYFDVDALLDRAGESPPEHGPFAESGELAPPNIKQP